MTVSRLSRIAYQRVRALVHPDDLERELEREFAFHLEQLRREQRSEGLTDLEAARAARRAFGNVAALADRSRDARGLTWLTHLAAGWPSGTADAGPQPRLHARGDARAGARHWHERGGRDRD